MQRERERERERGVYRSIWLHDSGMWLSWPPPPPPPSWRLGREPVAAPFIWTSCPEEVWGNCWEKRTDGEDKEGRLGDASWSSWEGFKLLMILLVVVVVLPPLPVPLQIICWTREVWNSPLFITAREMEERGPGEMRALLAATNACRRSSSLLVSLLLHTLSLCGNLRSILKGPVSQFLWGRGGRIFFEREEREQQQQQTGEREREREIKSIGAVRRGIWALFCFVFRFLLLHSFICELSLAFLRLLSLSTLPSPLSLSHSFVCYTDTHDFIYFSLFPSPRRFCFITKVM